MRSIYDAIRFARPVLSRVECSAKAIPLLGAVKPLESISDPSERMLASFAGIPVHINEMIPENMVMMVYSDHTIEEPHILLVKLT